MCLTDYRLNILKTFMMHLVCFDFIFRIWKSHRKQVVELKICQIQCQWLGKFRKRKKIHRIRIMSSIKISKRVNEKYVFFFFMVDWYDYGKKPLIVTIEWKNLFFLMIDFWKSDEFSLRGKGIKIWASK